MEKLKEVEDILYNICSDHHHYFDDEKRSPKEFLTDKDMALIITKRFIEADRIVRALAKAESVDASWILAAQNYVANNPNKEGGEGE